MVSIKEVEKHFKRDHLTRPMIKYFYYKITIWSSWIFVNLRFHENFVTFLSLFFALISAYLIFFVGGSWLILAAVFFVYGLVIDLADGTVARYYGRGSVLGLWFDEVIGFLSYFVVFMAVMMRHFIDTGDLWLIALGGYTIFSYMMINYAALFSQFMRSKHNLENPVEKLRKKASGKIGGFLNPGAFAFSLDVQWTLVGLGILFNAPYFLFIAFSVISTVQWGSRFFIFWGK
tara:strand:+ start:262 stop:957 length:696 start_codon:yes stop_codon:yes gene_type:complete